MKDSREIVDNISMLYELSLAIGNTLDIQKNAADFVESLMYKMNFSYVALWIDVSLTTESNNFYQLSYAYPKFQIQEREVFKEHPHIKNLQNEFLIVYTDKDDPQPPFTLKNQEKLCVLYSLGDVGFLELHSLSSELGENPLKLYSLQHVMKKFEKSIEAGLAYDRSLEETRKRSSIEQQLIVSEDKYRSVVRNIAEGLVITDLEGTITFANERIAELLGFDVNEIIGQKGYEIMVPKSLWGEYQQKLENRKKGLEENYELPLVDCNGELHWVSIRATPYRNSQGTILGTLAAIIDISNRKLVEQKIIESQTKLQLILETSLDAIVIIDEDGLVTDWNQNAEEVFGYTRFESIGQSFIDLVIPKTTLNGHYKSLQEFLKTGAGPILNTRVELDAKHKGGHQFPIELAMSPMKLDGVYSFSAYIRDITDRKKNENALIEAKKAADQARQAERQFLAHMSHEIRTPMNAVIGMTHLLIKSAREEQKDYLEALKFSADSLMNIISDILDLSKIEAGELSLDKRPFLLQKLVHQLQKSYQLKVQEKQVSVYVNIDPQIRYQVIGDQTRLNQILSNLLGNASKFTEEGYIGINVTLKREEEKTYWIEFDVYDTGIGISPGQIDKIFESFKQANTGIHTKFGGTGLGLSIVKQLVEIQNGQVDIKSKEGEGASFKVLLPYEISELPVKEEDVVVSVDEEAKQFLSALRILVAEDNQINQRLMESLLHDWKVDFMLVNNGQEAFDICEEQQFDLILMDVNMPIVGGLEATKMICTNSSLNKETPIIALTAAALKEEEIRMKKAGAVDFVAKPFAPKQLQQSILEALRFNMVEFEFNQKEAIVEKSTEPQFNLDYLIKFSHNNEAFVLDMIQMYLDLTPNYLEVVENSYATENWEALYNMAHQLKSTYGAMGMFKLQMLAESIEHHAKSGKIEKQTLESWITDLKEQTKSAYPAMQELVAQGHL